MFSFKINLYLLSRFLTNSISYIVLHARIHIRSRGSVTLCFRCDLNVSSCMLLMFKLVQNYIPLFSLGYPLFNRYPAAKCLSAPSQGIPPPGTPSSSAAATPRTRRQLVGPSVFIIKIQIIKLFYTIVNQYMIIFE